jgi:hypothetical protein
MMKDEVKQLILRKYFYNKIDKTLVNTKSGKFLKPHIYKGIIKGFALRNVYLNTDELEDMFESVEAPDIQGFEHTILSNYYYNINDRTLLNITTNSYLKPRRYSSGVISGYFILDRTIPLRYLEKLFIDKQTEKKEIKKQCINCDELYDLNHFTTKITCDFCLIDYLQKKRPESLENHTEYFKVRKFFLKMKAKKWMATTTDLFELIDIYDYYYPNLCIDVFDEDNAGHILHKLIQKNYEERSLIINESFS